MGFLNPILVVIKNLPHCTFYVNDFRAVVAFGIARYDKIFDKFALNCGIIFYLNIARFARLNRLFGRVCGNAMTAWQHVCNGQRLAAVVRKAEFALAVTTFCYHTIIDRFGIKTVMRTSV